MNKRKPRKSRPKRKQASEKTRLFAMYIAMVVRNAMEDCYVEHLSDSQMRELNPIIRNAIYTALHASEIYGSSLAAKRFVDLTMRMIPSYWENPVLLDSFLNI
jgi:hypothetical protein